MAMIAEKGVASGESEDFEEVCWEEAVDSGAVRSARDAEDSRSVTAEIGPVGLFEASIWEAVYILRMSGQFLISQASNRAGKLSRRPLDCKWQFVASGHILDHYILFFDTGGQQ